MRMIAMTAAAGGVGCSTAAAHTALMLQGWGHSVVLLELHPRNQLGTHLGLPQPQTEGWAALAIQGGWWGDAALSAETGLRMLPFGPCSLQDQAALSRLTLDQPDWLARQVLGLELPSDAVMVIDVGPPTNALEGQALAVADAVLCCTTPALDSVQSVGQLLAHLPTYLSPNAWMRLLVCRMDARRPSHQQGWLHIQSQWPQLLLEDVIHEDEALAQSWALGCTVQAHAQHSLSSHDLQGVAHTLHRWLGEPSTATP